MVDVRSINVKGLTPSDQYVRYIRTEEAGIEHQIAR